MESSLLPYKDSDKNREQLFEFYENVYPDSPWLLDPDRFIWQNVYNPLTQENEHPIWLLRDESGAIIGQNIYIFYVLKIDDNFLRGYCSTNLIVKQGIVGKGYGHKMISKNESFDGIAYAVGITYASTRAFQKRGWSLVEDARLMSKIINPTPNLKYMKMSNIKVALLAPLIKTTSFMFNIFSKLRLSGISNKFSNVTTQDINEFEEEWDEHWNEYLDDYAIHFKRVFYHLNYKYSSRKDVTHYKVIFKRDNVPVAYLVYRLSENKVQNLTIGRIVDIVYNPKMGTDFLDYVIQFAVDKLSKLHIDAIVGIAPNKQFNKSYKKNGFLFSRLQAAIINENDEKIKKLRAKYRYLWYITLGDSDLDNYW